MSETVHYWSDLAQLTHASQLAQFNFCMCEDLEERPYADCPEVSEFDYRVQWIGNYYEISTRVSVELSEYTGNLSDEAHERAITTAEESIAGELGISPTRFAHSIIVTLLLDGEEIAL